MKQAAKAEMLHVVPALSRKSPQLAPAPRPALARFSHSAGNGAVSGAIQAKLAIGRAHDPLEDEADRAAEHVMRCSCGGSGECEQCRKKRGGSQPILRRKSDAPAPSAAPPSVHQALRSPGKPLDTASRAAMEHGLGHDFSNVRIHTDTAAAQSAAEIKAHAYTVGTDVLFAAGRFAPETSDGKRLLAHELAHVVQQSSSAPVVQRDGDDLIEVDIASQPTDYTAPNCMFKHQVGEAYGPQVLLNIVTIGNEAATFYVFNFETGQPRTMTCPEWEMYSFSLIAPQPGFQELTKQLSPDQLRALWPNAAEKLMKMYEEGTIKLADEAVLSTYRGMIRSAASAILDANEAEIDAILDAPDRVSRLQDYATELKSALDIYEKLKAQREEKRQAIEKVTDQINEYIEQQAGSDMPRLPPQMLIRYRGELEKAETNLDTAIEVWEQAFPLLKRLRAAQITPDSVESTLRGIKSSIVATRAELDQAKLDPWQLAPVREQIAGQIGAKAGGVIKREERSQTIWAWIGMGVSTAAFIAIAFLPGGMFIDMAVGLAMAATAWDEAAKIGNAANTGLDPEAGLMSQAQADSAKFSAVVATVLAFVGPAAAGFRALKAARGLLAVSEALPGLGAAERVSLARAIADNPALLKAIAKGSEDQVVMMRIRTALREFGSDPKALKNALTEIGEFVSFRKLETEVMKDTVRSVEVRGADGAAHYLRYDKAGNVWLCSIICSNITEAAKAVLSANPVVLKDPQALQLVQNLINGGMEAETIAKILAIPAHSARPRPMLLLLAHLQIAQQRGVSGVAQVLGDLATGGNKAQGARFVLDYLEKTGKWAEVSKFEWVESAPGSLGDRRYDAIINDVLHQFKDWGEFNDSTFVNQIRKDLEITGLGKLKWVFNGSRLGGRKAIVQKAIEALRKAALKDPAFAAQARDIIDVLKSGGVIEAF